MEEQLAGLVSDVRGAAEQITAALVDVAPDALRLALEVVRWESIGQLLGGLVFLAFGVVSGTIGYRVLQYGRQLNKGPKRYEWQSPGEGYMVVGGGLGGLGLFLFGGLGLERVLYIWNWVGVFAPELRLAHDILQKVL